MDSSWFHSVSLVNEKCKGCTNCIKHCPTEAIRVRDGKAWIDPERCIDCGECIRVCENRAQQSLGDPWASIIPYKYRIAIPAPALMGQFSRGILPEQILGGLLGLGFNKVFETGYGADFTTIALKEYIKAGNLKKPLIASSCPAVVRLIQVRFPGLIEHLIPLEAPMVTAAKLAREEALQESGLKPEEIGVFFITPCPAKITMIKGDYGLDNGIINGALPINQIFGDLQHIITSGKAPLCQPRVSQVGVGWARAGGECAAVGIENYLAVDGIPNVVRVFEDLEMDKLNDLDYIEALACMEGCIGGALTVENPFVARIKIRKLADGRKLPEITPEFEDKARKLYNAGFFKWDYQLVPKPILKLDPDVSQAIQKMELIEKTTELLPGLDCGSCGAPSCRALAEDIVLGKAKLVDCVFKLREELSQLAQDLLKLSQYLPPALVNLNDKAEGRKK